jgi:hypothetical protein
LPNLIALACLSWCSKKYLRLSWPVTTVACLCFPVAIYGFASSMQDFFVNACVLAAAISLFYVELHKRDRHSTQALIFGLSMLTLAANVKTQGLILSLCILMLALAFWVSDCLSQSSFSLGASLRYIPLLFTRSYRILGISFLLFLLIVAQPMVNLYRFGNPVYPVGFWRFKGSEGTNVSTIPYLTSIPIVYNGLSFLASSSEIDPILRSDKGMFFFAGQFICKTGLCQTGSQPTNLEIVGFSLVVRMESRTYPSWLLLYSRR